MDEILMSNNLRLGSIQAQVDQMISRGFVLNCSMWD